MSEGQLYDVIQYTATIPATQTQRYTFVYNILFNHFELGFTF